MRSFLLAAFVVAMAPAAYAGHADKDGPFAHANDNQIGTSTPYPGTPVLKEDADGQIGANFATTWPEVKLRAQVAAQAIGGNQSLGRAPNADLATKQ